MSGQFDHQSANFARTLCASIIRFTCVGSNSPRRFDFRQRRRSLGTGLGHIFFLNKAWAILRYDNSSTSRSLTASVITACSASSSIKVLPSESNRYPYGTSLPVFTFPTIAAHGA